MSLCCGAVCGGGSEKEQCCLLCSRPAFSHLPCFPQANCVLSGADFLVGGWLNSLTLTDSPIRLKVSAAAATPKGFIQPEVLKLYFPVLEPWVAWSVSLPSCSSRFIRMQVWDRRVCQPLSCCTSSPPGLPVSTLPIHLNECFFFNPLVVKTPTQFDFLAVLVFCF